MAFGMMAFPLTALAQRPRGIDVSHYQGTVNWTNVYNAGRVFALAKSSESVNPAYDDAYFVANMTKAKAVGVLIGPYHFARPLDNPGASGATNEADWFISRAGQYMTAGYLRPVLDLESGGNPDKTVLSTWANAFCNRIKQVKGVSPIIYTGQYFASAYLNNTLTNWPVWIAQYPYFPDPQNGNPSATPWSSWSFWQFSSTGTVAGVSGNCDEDVFNGTYATLVANFVIGGTVTNPPTIVSQPQSLTLNLGAPAMFNVHATGVGPLSFQWRFNQTNIAGATATNYSLASVQLTNAGGFSVAISNAGGITLSTQAFLSVYSPLSNAPGCILSPSNMVSWWAAEGNPYDIFSTNHAAPHDGFSYVAGKQIRAFRFDGLTGYLSITATSIPPPWTACMWVNRQNAPGTGAALMGDGTYELKLEQYNGTRQVGFTRFGVGDYNFGYTAPVGVWTHLAFVGTTSNTLLYVNGALQSTLTNTLPLPRAYIGAGYVNTSARFVDFMQGGLDEILLYNRALSGPEISAIAAAGSAGLVRIPEFTGIEQLPNGQMRVQVKGQTGKSFTIYGSINLLNWGSMGALANPAGSIQFTNNLFNPGLFYRAKQP